MPNSSGSVDLSAKRQESTEEEPTQEAGQPTQVLTAFAIIVGPDGNPQILAYEHEDIEVEHEATPDMVFAACSTVIKDIQSQETAQAAAHMTAQLMVQQAQAIAQQQQAAQMRASLPTDLRRG